MRKKIKKLKQTIDSKLQCLGSIATKPPELAHGYCAEARYSKNKIDAINEQVGAKGLSGLERKSKEDCKKIENIEMQVPQEEHNTILERLGAEMWRLTHPCKYNRVNKYERIRDDEFRFGMR